MNRAVWVGFLLVVPVGACLYWMTTDTEGAKDSNLRASVSPAAPPGSERTVPEPPPLVVAPDREDDVRSDASEAPQDESAELSDDDFDDFEEEIDPVEESRRIRLPVIQAIRGSHPTPEARREAMLKALRRSGPSNEAWTRQSTAVFDDWMRGLSTAVEFRPNWSSAQCYQAGCEVELSFPDRASYERAAEEFRSLREGGATHGGRVQTPAVESDSGEILASWIMMRPDGSRT